MIENETPVQDWRHDPRSNEDLLYAALTEDEDQAWDAIMILQVRSSLDIFEAARQLCASQDARERRVGADILGQLGLLEQAFHEESVELLLGMLEQEQDPDVLDSVAVALGHRKDPRAIEPLARLKNHLAEDVRFGVVFGLLTHEDELAIQTLIELSTDVHSLVRDWATFGIGSQIETDTPAIRAALMERVTDEDPDTRSEAIMGLARRRDQRVVELLLTRLESQLADTSGLDSLSYRELEAIEELGDPRFYPILARFRGEWQGSKNTYLYGWLEDAIAACQPELKTEPGDYGYDPNAF